MDSGQSTLSASPPLTKFKERPPPCWVPCAGTKRKACIANLSDNFDPECRPSPAKQFAVDEEVATDILRGGFYYDPSIPPSSNNENDGATEEVEMEEEPVLGGVYIKGPGDTTHSAPSSCKSMTRTVILDEKECRDDSVISTHSMHESQPNSPSKHVSSKAQSLVMKGLSLILSNEIQATLTRKKLNEDFILPKSIMDQVSGMRNSMALVPWKPPVRMESLVNPRPVVIQMQKPLVQEMASRVQHIPEPDSLPSPCQTVPLPIAQARQMQMKLEPSQSLSQTNDEDVEGMDVDI